MVKFYGKAGVPLTPEELEARSRARAARRNRQAAAEAAALEEARARHARGLVRPYMITHALDAMDLYGPEVDTACGVREPTVDLWEAGHVYPTFDQLCALATLTRVTPLFLTRDHHVAHDGRMFLCGPGVKYAGPAEPPVYTFTPEAMAAAGLTPWARTRHQAADVSRETPQTPTLF